MESQTGEEAASAHATVEAPAAGDAAASTNHSRPEKPVVTVASCLEAFATPEELSGESAYACEECARRAKQKRLEAARVGPEILARDRAWSPALRSGTTASCRLCPRRRPARRSVFVSGAADSRWRARRAIR